MFGRTGTHIEQTIFSITLLIYSSCMTAKCLHCYNKHSFSGVAISLVGHILASLALDSAKLISATKITPLVSIDPFLCLITYKF